MPEAGKDRARALGSELIEVHDWLRRELRLLQAELADGSTDRSRRRVRCALTASASAPPSPATTPAKTAGRSPPSPPSSPG
ncbi:MAG: hypothetical protein ACM32E_04780 [Gemmatimonadota bacterium]